MAGNNGHSKRPIPKAKKQKSSKGEKSFVANAMRAILKRQGRNN